MTDTTQKSHMRLSASAAHRWTHCPASIRFAESLPQAPGGAAAKWGTRAHAWLEYAVKNGEVSLADYIGCPLEGFEDATTLCFDMIEAVDAVLDQVWTRAGSNSTALHAERSLVATSVHPDCGGTADVTIVHANGDITVIDAKFGYVIVETEDNEQLETYAIAAIDAAKRDGLEAPERVDVMIVQPRASHADGRARTVTYWTMDLLDARRKLRMAAKACDAKDAPCNPGEWCKYCPAAYWQKCDAFRQTALASATAAGKNDFDAIEPKDIANPFEMPPDELGRRLAQAEMLRGYLKALEDYAFASARSGKCPSGFKLVEGRGRRMWSTENADDVAKRLAALDPRADFMPRELLTVAQAEKLVGKSRFAAVSDLVANKPGSLTLASASDKRPAVDISKIDQYEAVDA